MLNWPAQRYITFRVPFKGTPTLNEAADIALAIAREIVTLNHDTVENAYYQIDEGDGNDLGP